jgi:hypothetical protein
MCRVEVEILREGEPVSSQPGMQEDVSDAGAGISVRKAIAMGARVRVRARSREAIGTVKQCRPEGHGFFVGVQFDTGIRQTNAQ